MIDHPDFFNPRKMAVVFAAGPLAFLLVLVAIDFSWHQLKTQRMTNYLCNQPEHAGKITQLDGNQCPGNVQYTGQR